MNNKPIVSSFPYIESKILPVLPLRDVVAFPRMTLPLFVGRARSAQALDEALRNDKLIFLLSQKDTATENPQSEELFQVGCIAQIMQLVKMPDGNVKVLIAGQQRAQIKRYLPHPQFLMCDVSGLKDVALAAPVSEEQNKEHQALYNALLSAFESYSKMVKHIPGDFVEHVRELPLSSELADLMAGQIHAKIELRQNILECLDVEKRLSLVLEVLEQELELLQLERRIRTRVKKQMEKTQKEYFLNEQMQAIQKELGDRDEQTVEIEELNEKLATKNLPDESRERIAREIQKLKRMGPMSAEATVVRNYIDWCLNLPWQSYTSDNLDLDNAERILDEDHFGLEKPKERIIEYLAVKSLVSEMKGPILCFVGPPGVGKTSLGRSIARCMDRKFVRLSLGGVRDEAEIRGHRRTYIGALPGKIIQNIKRAGSSNPLMLLDEVDKLSADFRGDPSAALLEVLDPEVNATFNDHYLDMDYDLSKVMFICTANSLQGIPAALRDRMEIIRLPGYTETEKLEIASKYLVPKQVKENGLSAININWNKEVLRLIIRRYTREAGVRNLERELGSLCRKLARKVAKDKTVGAIRLNSKKVAEYLGVFHFAPHKKEEKSELGLANGLAWTEVGGELLSVEVSLMPGKGKLLITGKLGEVMQESAQAAMSYVRSRAGRLGLAKDFYSKVDIHIHVPEGAMPKDGPSAGITMATALVSALTRCPVHSDIAMTGELTLRGRVLAIGGLKEKALAAFQGECKKVLFPKDNEKDLPDIPLEVRRAIEFVPVEHMDQVLSWALDYSAAGAHLFKDLSPDDLYQDLHVAPATAEPLSASDSQAESSATTSCLQ